MWHNLRFSREYPNLFDESLPFLAGCANSENVQNAVDAFIRCCPTTTYVEKVEFFKAFQPPICRWFVKYKPIREDRVLPQYDLQKYFQSLYKYIPMDCIIVDRYLQEYNNPVIVFGVNCSCPKPLLTETIQFKGWYLREFCGKSENTLTPGNNELDNFLNK